MELEPSSDDRPKARPRSLFRIIAVDFAFTLVAITAVLLAIRMRQGERAKDIADNAQVTVRMPAANACQIAVWDAHFSGGAKLDLDHPKLKTPVPFGLPQTILVAEAGDGHLICSVQVSLREGCDKQMDVLAAAAALMERYKASGHGYGKDFAAFAEDFRRLAVLAGKGVVADEAGPLIASLEHYLFSKEKYVFCDRRRRGIDVPCDHGVGIGHAAYRIDRFATRLGLAKKPGLYGRYLKSDFAPGRLAHLAHYKCLVEAKAVRPAEGDNGAAAERAVQTQAFKLHIDPARPDGIYLKQRCQLTQALEAVLFGAKGPELAKACLVDRRACEDWGDSVAYLLAVEAIALLAGADVVKVEVEVQASGDLKEATRECRQLPLTAVLGKGMQELFTVQFARGNRPSRLEWKLNAVPCPK